MSEQPDSATARQPMPAGNGDVVLGEVIIDLIERSKQGAAKYGTPLRTHNGRNALVDAYQEALDLCMYLKQCLMERERLHEYEAAKSWWDAHCAQSRPDGSDGEPAA